MGAESRQYCQYTKSPWVSYLIYTYIVLKSFSSGFDRFICFGVSKTAVLVKFPSFRCQFIDIVVMKKGIPTTQQINKLFEAIFLRLGSGFDSRKLSKSFCIRQLNWFYNYFYLTIMIRFTTLLPISSPFPKRPPPFRTCFFFN